MDFAKMTVDADRVVDRRIHAAWAELGGMPTDQLTAHQRIYARDVSKLLSFVAARMLQRFGARLDLHAQIDRLLLELARPLDMPTATVTRQRLVLAWEMVHVLTGERLQRDLTEDGADLQAMYLLIQTVVELKLWIAVVEQVDLNHDMFRSMRGEPHLRRLQP